MLVLFVVLFLLQQRCPSYAEDAVQLVAGELTFRERALPTFPLSAQRLPFQTSEPDWSGGRTGTASPGFVSVTLEAREGLGTELLP